MKIPDRYAPTVPKIKKPYETASYYEYEAAKKMADKKAAPKPVTPAPQVPYFQAPGGMTMPYATPGAEYYAAQNMAKAFQGSPYMPYKSPTTRVAAAAAAGKSFTNPLRPFEGTTTQVAAGGGGVGGLYDPHRPPGTTWYENPDLGGPRPYITPTQQEWEAAKEMAAKAGGGGDGGDYYGGGGWGGGWSQSMNWSTGLIMWRI
jgi:hypothetical protein